MNFNITDKLIPANVLLVDDKEENLFSLQSLLDDKRSDVNFIHASSGNEALKIVYKTEVAVILLDVQMPGMNGYEVVALLKQKQSTQNIPIIFVTALNHETKYVVEGYSKGAVDYLFKPLDPVITKSKVNTFISIYQQQKKLELAYVDLEKIVVERTEDLSNKNDALSRINRDLDQFVHVASHDLKLPIANIEGLLTALCDDLAHVPHQSEDILKMMGNSVAQMKETISGLITIIKNKETQDGFEEIDCKKIIEEVEVIISTLLKESKTTILIHSDSLTSIRFNKTVFKSILYNLITNSVKYHHPDRDPIIEISLHNRGEMVVLMVKDNGMGMNDRAINNMFKLFSRANPEKAEGTGMGLYNLKNMLDKYGATIEVSSTEGEGTEFSILLKA